MAIGLKSSSGEEAEHKGLVPPPLPARKRNPPKKKEKPPTPKLAYLMTQEELDESVAKHVKSHFAPKKAPPK